MAHIRPFRGWRYAPEFTPNISDLVSPLFDVISDKQRQKLYGNPLNSIHLSVPERFPFAESARNHLENGKKNGVFIQDNKLTIYAYYQYFTLPNDAKEYCRKGFIAMIRVYDWDENMILRHEKTIPKAVHERIDILRQTDLNVSPTHGLYTDSDKELEKYLDEAIRNPIYEIEDYQGVREVLAAINAPEICAKFVEKLTDKQVILADGHHRYEASLAIQKERQAQNPNHTGKEAYNFHLMYLTNTESEDVRILPTHRLITDFEAFNQKLCFEKLATHFTIREIEEAESLPEIICGKKYAFGILIGQKAFKIRMKPEKLDWIAQNLPLVERTNTAILHRYVIDEAIGIPLEQHPNSAYLNFERNFTTCLQQVLDERAKIALITNEITIEEVKEICYTTGEQMPQKSTYFYPKAICGFVFGSIRETEV